MLSLWALLGCGPETSSDPGVTAARVDHAPLPGIRIGSDGARFVQGRSNLGTPLGDGYSSAQSLTLGSFTDPDLVVIVRPADQVVMAVWFRVPTPGPVGKSQCDEIYAAVVEELGPPVDYTSGFGIYPEARWYGTDLEVLWRRTGPLGEEDYTCAVEWSFVPGPR